jgi:hypothetical protein
LGVVAGAVSATAQVTLYRRIDMLKSAAMVVGIIFGTLAITGLAVSPSEAQRLKTPIPCKPIVKDEARCPYGRADSQVVCAPPRFANLSAVIPEPDRRVGRVSKFSLIVASSPVTPEAHGGRNEVADVVADAWIRFDRDCHRSPGDRRSQTRDPVQSLPYRLYHPVQRLPEEHGALAVQLEEQRLHAKLRIEMLGTQVIT